MIVKIDSREQNRVKTARRLFEELNHETIIEQLPIGDYVCGQCVVEFKTASDFLASIFDGRLFTEAINQADNFNHHFIMIIGDVDKAIAINKHFIADFNKVSFYKVVSKLCTFTNVLFFRDSYDAFLCMHELFLQCNAEDKPLMKKVQKISYDNPAANYLACIPGISTKRAIGIAEQLELNTLADLIRLTKDDLLKVDGVGNILAEKIITAIKGGII